MNEIKSALIMEGDISKGPMPRWQKKLNGSSANLNASANTSKISISYNSILSTSTTAPAINKTPQKNSSVNFKGKSPGRKTPTPNKGTSGGSKTPCGANGGDRFIPNRASSNFDIGHYKMNIQKNSSDENEETNRAGDRQKILSEAMELGDVKTRRVFSYQEKAPAAPESHQNPLRVVYSIKTPMSTKSGSRYIPTSPERILDAPDIINDYYLNLMDWSASNIVTVALGKIIYLWNAGTGNIEQLREYDNGDHACSLAWIQEGNVLAIGASDGTVELWDAEAKKRLRVMDGHTARVGSLAWNSYIISSGSRDGSIIHHDVRQRDHKVTTLNGHTQEVCGLKWSTDFKYLASGGNDNLVNIWPSVTGSNAGVNTSSGVTEALHVFNQHHAAVRALAWCPWQPNVLASGGGTADRCIKFWNVNNGTLIDSIDSKSQVCSLLWSKTYKEIISAHGFANNQLTIWKYPSMQKQCELTGHTARVLQMAMSPDGSTVMSAAADETLRLWNCFAPDVHQAKKDKSASKLGPSIFRPNIR
ncbi:cell division cycle protein 20 homolog isoform X3 [Contarinia nasturtii]|nr:cell division cycle protein 20 homolog isoform X3 [Contarinia nasturtii]XP_031636530.1 cell division cycle protein 20 homolog isoform X3 [Contarinia nasturtii]